MTEVRESWRTNSTTGSKAKRKKLDAAHSTGALTLTPGLFCTLAAGHRFCLPRVLHTRLCSLRHNCCVPGYYEVHGCSAGPACILACFSTRHRWGQPLARLSLASHCNILGALRLRGAGYSVHLAARKMEDQDLELCCECV